jgi:short-subunit dehydrogenase
MKPLVDRVAAITGAGSGIGRALALDLAGRGNHLALSDIDEEGLEETRKRAEAAGVRVTATRVDVADREAVEAWATASGEAHGGVSMVFNNAGVAVGGDLRNVSFEDFHWLMNINFWGVVHGTRAFLPLLDQEPSAHIVNISSVFGIISVPTQGVYNAAKFAVRGYSEALRMELEIEGSAIGVSCVHPGGIRTNIARSARYDKALGRDGDELADEFDAMARTTPEQCAATILRGVERNAPRILVGADARLIDAIQRLAPTGYQRVVKAFAKRRIR